MRPVVKGSADQSVVIRIVDSADGTPETGVVYNTSGIDLWYRREGAAKVSITEATLSALTDAHSDGGVLHIGDGYYRLDLPDAAVASGANGVAVGGAVTGMVVIGCYVPLCDVNPYDAVRMGMTALPNAAADAAGGLPISDAGGLDIDTLIGRLDAAITSRMASYTQPTGFLAATFPGTVASTTNITAGTITTVTNLTNAPTAGDLTATMKTSVNTEVAAALGTYDGPTNAEMVARTIAAADYATAAELAKVPKSDGTATWNSTALASINAEADTALSDYGALKPTTAGRTLDVTETGAAGIDWGNVENPTTTVGLSGTTVKTATDVETDTADIQSRIPAALSGGRMAVDLQAIGNDTQSATDLKDFADTGYDPVTHWAKVTIEAIGGQAGGVSNLHDFAASGYDPGLHQVLLVAATTTAEALGTQAKADVNAEVDTALGDYDGPTNAEMEARTLVAVNYATATDLATVDTVVDGIASRLQGVVLEAATIGATGNSTTAIHLPGLTYGDDEIINYLLVIRDVSEDEYHARWITDWVSSTAVATVATLPFTPQDSTDTYWLLSARADVTGGSGASATDIRIEMDANSTKLANLDATMSSRATPAQVATELATYDGPTNAEFEARTIASASYATATALGTTDTAVQTLTTRVGIPAVSVSDDLAAVKTDTGNLVTRITSTLFSGITSLAQMLGIMAGKQVGDTTARNELRATGAGSGTFDETTDSLQAVRDRGDAAWTTATGFAVPGSEMGLADGAITAAKIGTGAITAAKFAAGAIDAAALNADAVAEIQSGLSTVTTAQVLTQVNAALDTAIAELGIGTPATTPSLRNAIMLLYMEAANESQDTTTQRKIKNAAGTVIAQGTVTSATGSVVLGKLASP